MAHEIPIEELRGRYFATEDGHILNKDGMQVKPFISKQGYLRVKLHTGHNVYKNYQVHILIAKTFIQNPYNLPQVNHKGGNKQNPAAYNLEWSTQSSNIKHAVRSGLYPHQKDNQHKASMANANAASIPIEQLDDDGNVINTFRNKYDAARALGLMSNNIKRAINTCDKCGGYYWRKAGDES